jgi:hypothetical protein
MQIIEERSQNSSKQENPQLTTFSGGDDVYSPTSYKIQGSPEIRR